MKHIIVGNESDDYFSGGHDFGFFEENYLNGNTVESVFFDTNTSTFVTSSKKGDSLIEIIRKIKAGEKPNYHTLFPKDVLNEEFILESFKIAFENNGVDQNDHTFRAQNGDFLVKGFFSNNGNNYQIKTIFPDADSFYSNEFSKEQFEKKIDQSRFLEWGPEIQLWIARGLNPVKILKDQSYNYSSVDEEQSLRLSLIFNFQTLSSLEKRNRVWPHCNFVPDGIDYRFSDRPSSTCQLSNAKMLSLSKEIETAVNCNLKDKTVSVLDFFFDDPKKPQAVELLSLKLLLGYLDPSLSKLKTNEKKSNTVLRKYVLLKMALRNFQEPLYLSAFCLDPQSLSQFVMLRKDVSKSSSLNFAEELIHSVLYLNLWSEKIAEQNGIKPFSSKSHKKILVELSQKFANNFLKYALGEALWQKAQEENLGIYIHLVHRGNNARYALSFGKIALNNENLLEAVESRYSLLFVDKLESQDPLKLKFSKITIAKNN